MASKPIEINKNKSAKIAIGKGVMRGIQKTKQETLLETVKGAPENWGAWAKLAEVYASEKNWKRAISCYQKVLKGSPLSPGMKSHIGVIFARGFRMEKAYQLVEQAIQEEPSNQHHKLD